MILEVFLAFLKIGLFSYGGGYAMLPFIQNQAIEVHRWLSMNEFLDILGIAQVTPGPVAINTATFVGYRTGGIPGAIAATTAVILPSFIIVLSLSFFIHKFKESKLLGNIFKGLRPIVLGLVASAAVDIGRGVFVDYKAVIISLGIFLLLVSKKGHTVTLLMLAGLLGVLFY